jgi:hypothetical protein
MAEELLLLSPAQIEAAASVGRLGRLAERLVEERSWSSLDLLLTHAGLEVIPLEELAAAARSVDRALGRIPESRSTRATTQRELRGVRALAAATISRRLHREPLTTAETEILALAAELFLGAGEQRQAARHFERAGRDADAADAYAAVGDIERMEACHARLEARTAERREAGDTQRRVEALMSAGERVAALSLLKTLPPARLTTLGLDPVYTRLEQGLVRGRALTVALRGEHGSSVRLSGTPAVLGRDPSCEIALRDPGVSRRHAVIVSDGQTLAIEDASSRAGTRLGGARLGSRVPLGGETELALGAHCTLLIRPVTSTAVEIRGVAGIDRGLLAMVGAGKIDLGGRFSGLAGVTVCLEGGVARLERAPFTRAKIDGQLVGLACDILRGDLVEVTNASGDVHVLEFS